MASKNKRYLKNQNAWEDDDRKFDDELEQKHTALMFEDLFFHQKMSRHDDKTKSRTEFEIYSKKKTVWFDEEEIDLGKYQNSISLGKGNKLKATSDSSNKSPVEQSEHNNQTTYRDEEKLDWSDIVWVDKSIEDKMNVKKSKSKIDRFKELVDQSNSKHLSSLSSVNIWKNNQREDSMFEIDSNDFDDLAEKLSDIRKKELNKEQAISAINYFKDELSIDKWITSWLLLPSLKSSEGFGIKPAVYDFIYHADKIQEPKLERFRGEFCLKN